ncbi:MAG TPA: hypothetical protein VD866_30135 [Urbifossiella sp.]|nr:hypothetical protein [Urbifossiella sp.]
MENPYRTTSVVFPVLLTTVGVAWLLTVEQADPRIHWVPVLGMAVVGVLTLVMGGLDKVTVAVGPFLLACTGFAVARQTGHITVERMLPCLVIVAGALMFAAHLLPVPYPRWLQPAPPPPPERPKRLTLDPRDAAPPAGGPGLGPPGGR